MRDRLTLDRRRFFISERTRRFDEGVIQTKGAETISTHTMPLLAQCARGPRNGIPVPARN